MRRDPSDPSGPRREPRQRRAAQPNQTLRMVPNIYQLNLLKLYGGTRRLSSRRSESDARSREPPASATQRAGRGHRVPTTEGRTPLDSTSHTTALPRKQTGHRRQASFSRDQRFVRVPEMISLREASSRTRASATF